LQLKFSCKYFCGTFFAYFRAITRIEDVLEVATKINLMKNKFNILTILTTLFLSCPLDLFSQFKTFTGINDTQYNYVDEKLEQLGFGKVTYYYNDLTKKRWKMGIISQDFGFR
jgi:hypothetical protein